MHYPYIRPIRMAAVFMARMYRYIFDIHMYGPYVPAVCMGSAYRPLVHEFSSVWCVVFLSAWTESALCSL